MERALEDIKILDFSHLLQGPFATQLLGDLGADVIKIERVGAGDMFRSITFFNSWVGGTESPCFLAWNRNKRSLAVNIKSPMVREILMDIAKTADIVVQNFRPGVMEKLGYGYEDFRAVNDTIIYCSGSGYGESGPYVTRPGQDMLIQGLTGVCSATGRADQPPVTLGAGLPDQLGAMNMVYGILAALVWRSKSGKGQKVEVNLLAGMMAHLNQEYVSVLNLDRDFERPTSGIGHPGAEAPFGIYATCDNRYVSIAMSPFGHLAKTLGAEHLLKYDSADQLFAKRDEIWEAVNAVTKSFDCAPLLEVLLKADIWTAEVKDFRAAAKDPQVEHLGLIQSYDHPLAGTVQVVGPAINLSETPSRITRPAPMIGEHGAEILAEYGIEADEIAQLVDAGDLTIQTV